MALALIGAAVQAAPLAELATHPKSGAVSKGKAMHFIENRPAAVRPKAEEGARESENSVPEPEKPSASEPSPLELKGVRG